MTGQDMYSKFLGLFEPLVPDSLRYRVIIISIWASLSALTTLYLAYNRFIAAIPFMMFTMFTSYGVGKLLVLHTIEKSDYTLVKEDEVEC